MSIWTEMEDRGTGEGFRKEDDQKIYSGSPGNLLVLTSGTYSGYKYSIETNGKYPSVAITMPHDQKSNFDGYGVVVLKDGDDRYDLERLAWPSGITYMYEFNKEGDHIEGSPVSGEDRRYTMMELLGYVKKFIDILVESENNLSNRNVELLKSADIRGHKRH